MNPCTAHKDCQTYHLGQSGERPTPFDQVAREWTTLLTNRCSTETIRRVYSVVRYGPAYNERLIWHTGPKLAEYQPGQSYPDEVRAIRKELLK